MSNADTSTEERDRYGMTPADWARLDAMTDEEITAAALADPDAQPISPERLATWRPPALSKVIRQKLGMTRQRFTDVYGIPVEAQQAWERNEAAPTATEIAYLRLIERAPDLARLTAAAE